jgi:hypothetical protein
LTKRTKYAEEFHHWFVYELVFSSPQLHIYLCRFPQNDIATMMYKNNETRCFYENIKIELNRLLSFQTVLFEVISGSTVDKHR